MTIFNNVYYHVITFLNLQLKQMVHETAWKKAISTDIWDQVTVLYFSSNTSRFHCNCAAALNAKWQRCRLALFFSVEGVSEGTTLIDRTKLLLIFKKNCQLTVAVLTYSCKLRHCAHVSGLSWALGSQISWVTLPSSVFSDDGKQFETQSILQQNFMSDRSIRHMYWSTCDDKSVKN